MKTINWGIVGLGRIAHKFVQDIRLVEGARLHAVASRSLSKAKSFGEQYQSNHFYGSYEELIDCEDLDVVYIATPHVFHCENTLLFLKNKIPVLCEKPMGMNLREVQQMIDCAKENDTYLMQAIWSRFFPIIEKAKTLVEKGIIGKIKAINSNFGFHKKWDPSDRVLNKELGGGGILDVGIYNLFLCYLFLGQPKEIQATSVINELGVDEISNIVLKYDDGVLCNIFCSISTLTDVEACIYGQTGKLKFHSKFHQPHTISYGDYYEEVTTIKKLYPGYGYQFEIEAVGKDMQSGKKENELLTHQFSLQLTELIDKVRIAAGVRYPQDDL